MPSFADRHPSSPLPGKLDRKTVAVRFVLGLQLLQSPEQLPRLARVVADALALLDQGELTFLVAAAVPDGLLGLFEHSLGGGSRHNVGTPTQGGWFDRALSHRRTGTWIGHSGAMP